MSKNFNLVKQNGLSKICANSTVINPDKKKTRQGPSSCVFDKLGCVSAYF
jgi:hypothetical protein